MNANLSAPVDGATDNAAEDLALLRAGQQGDRAALERLLKRHEAELLRLCCGVLPTVADAEDAVQEAFLKALKAIAKPGGFRGESSVRTWLYRIALNVCWDWKRRGRFFALLSTTDFSPDIRSSSPGPEQAALDRVRLRDAFARLSPRHRTLVTLREGEGWSVAEIAALLGWNEKKVHNELYAARRVLARWREGEDE